MRIRRATQALTTCVVAILVALAVPTSQLHTVSVVKECCCPDPDDCHCPPPTPCGDHVAMRACHQHVRINVSPVTPAFVLAAPVQVAIETRVGAAPMFVPSSLHEAPDPRRPSAPS